MKSKLYTIDAYMKGKQDYKDGKTLRDNPYKTTDVDMKNWWYIGWREEEGAAIQENNYVGIH